MQNAIFQYKALTPDAPRGIYITLHGEDRKVYPYELFATLWDERNRRLLCEGVEAECRIYEDEIDCVFFDYKRGRYLIEYKRDSFILSADSALRQLCDDILNSRQTIYGDRCMKSAHAERMLEGLCAMNVHRNYNQSFSTDAIIEKFTFEFEDEYACDTPFVIGIGNRFYRSCFSDWSNELDVLRYELEGLVLRTTRNVKAIEMEERERADSNTTGYTLAKSIALWINGFTAFSVKPLRIATFVGMMTALAGFITGIIMVIRKLINPVIAMGYTSLAVIMLFIGGMILMCLGLVGEYVGRIYICINKSPQYVVKNTINVD